MTRPVTPPTNRLWRSISIWFGGSVAVIGVTSGIVQLMSIWSLSAIALGALVAFAIAGWASALYVALSPDAGPTPSSFEKLIDEVTQKTSVSFSSSWLRSTVLNPEAVDQYWRTSTGLRIETMKCVGEISGTNITNTIEIAGINDSRQPLETLRMILLGGSVLHHSDIAGQSSSMTSGKGAPATLTQRCVAELGGIHVVELRLPLVLQRNDRFEIRHAYSWPGAMSTGEDMMWYPYPAMFEGGVSKLNIELIFDSQPRSVRGFDASLSFGTFGLSASQPSPRANSNGLVYDWDVGDTESDGMVAIVFER